MGTDEKAFLLNLCEEAAVNQSPSAVVSAEDEVYYQSNERQGEYDHYPCYCLDGYPIVQHYVQRSDDCHYHI